MKHSGNNPLDPMEPKSIIGETDKGGGMRQTTQIHGSRARSTLPKGYHCENKRGETPIFKTSQS